jgi:hypothetical protein
VQTVVTLRRWAVGSRCYIVSVGEATPLTSNEQESAADDLFVALLILAGADVDLIDEHVDLARGKSQRLPTALIERSRPTCRR